MPLNPKIIKDIEIMRQNLINSRKEFEEHVEKIADEIISLSKSISPSIGEISVTEAKQVLIREFTTRL